MANFENPIVVGNIHTNFVNQTSGLSENYRVVTTWYDGTPMTSGKCDGDLYRKKGSQYLRKVINKDGELFLEKDTMAQVRALTSREILYLKAGVYRGVKLNGYYVKNDTPTPIEYYLSETADSDDGGSVIVVGPVKLEHDFGGYVDVRYFGVKGDGTDETIQIQRAINKAEGGIWYVPKGKSNYLSGQIYVPSDIFIQHDSVDWLGVDTLNQTAQTFEGIFRMVNSENVTLMLGSSTYRMNKEFYLSEHNSLFILDSVKNIEFNGGVLLENGGDGIYITGLTGSGVTVPKGSKTYSEDIRLNNVKVYGAKRNGVSLVGIKGFTATNCVFSNSFGTSIAAGFDVEPESRCEYSTDITLINCQFLNNGGNGFMCAYQKTLEVSNTIDSVDIKLINCYSNGNRNGFSFGHFPNKISGKIDILNCTAENNVYNGFLEFSKGIGVKTYYDTPTMKNNNTSGDNLQSNGHGAQFLHKIRSDRDWVTGNTYINNPVVIDDRVTPLTDKGISFLKLSGSTANPINFTVINPTIKGAISQSIFVSPEISDVKFNFLRTPEFIAQGTFNMDLTAQHNKSELTNSGRTSDFSFRLPISEDGLEYTFRVKEPYLLGIVPKSGSLILGLQRSGTTYSVGSHTVGNSLTLRGREDGNWDVIKSFGFWSNMENSWSTTNRPINPKTGRNGYNITLGVQEYYNGTAWVQNATTANATPTTKGLVNQAAYSADTATVASGANPTKAEFDALFNEFRDFKNKNRTSGQSASS